LWSGIGSANAGVPGHPKWQPQAGQHRPTDRREGSEGGLTTVPGSRARRRGSLRFSAVSPSSSLGSPCVETDATRMCAVLVGLPRVRVVGVGEWPMWLRLSTKPMNIRVHLKTKDASISREIHESFNQDVSTLRGMNMNTSTRWFHLATAACGDQDVSILIGRLAASGQRWALRRQLHPRPQPAQHPRRSTPLRARRCTASGKSDRCCGVGQAMLGWVVVVCLER